VLPLRCEAKTTSGKALVQIAARFFVLDQTHCVVKISLKIKPVKI
jgi:hypothetical protein